MILRKLGYLIFAVVLMPMSGCEKKQPEIPKAVPLSEDGSMELKLMTFNLRYENAGETGRRAWSERILGIVKRIRSEEPDVFGIQEGLHGQVADLRISLSDYGFAGVGRNDGKRLGEYAGIFFRKDRFEKNDEKSGMIWLSDTPEVAGSKSWGNEIPRIATWVLLNDRASGQQLWAVNMHLDHKSQTSREKGVRLMAQKLSTMNSSSDPIVWMGDFNAVENNQALRFLSGKSSEIKKMANFSGLRETFDALHPNDSKRGTLHFWMSDPNRQWKVDHILVSKEAKVLDAEIVKSGEPYLSDHFPVTARVRFPPKAAR